MKMPSLRDRLRYAFDNSLSRGTVPFLGWLAVASLVLVLVSAVLLWSLGLSPVGRFVDLTWMLILHTLGKSIPEDQGASWAYLLSMLVISYAGVFITGTLIAVLTEAVRSKIANLREGRSRVIESGHTVILGWSPHTLVILRELVTAKASDPRSCLVVLADRDKVQMDSDVRAALPHTGRTRIVCRHGHPGQPLDLRTANLGQARSIIIPAPEVDDPDSEVIRILLAVHSDLQDHESPAHVVAEIKRPWNLSVAHLAGSKDVDLVWTGDLISRITAQTCREPGLSVVYTELLNFEGDEIYFRLEPQLVGRTFGDALLSYEDSCPVGLLPAGGTLRLNPPADTVIQENDQVILIAEDDSSIRLSGRRSWDIRSDLIAELRRTPQPPDRILVLGWNWLAASILGELDSYVTPGSNITVVADVARAREEIRRARPGLKNTKVRFHLANTTDRPTLEKLGVAQYGHVIVLCYCDTLERQKADARTLVTLLHLREFAERAGHPFSIVTEMLDVRTRDLAEVARADDFIVSEQFVSLALAQISERRELSTVFAELFNPEGSEIHLHPAGDYVRLGQPVDFYTVVEAAKLRHEVAIGYHQQAHSSDASRSYGVVLNPRKSDAVAFAEVDRIIILAEA